MSKKIHCFFFIDNNIHVIKFPTHLNHVPLNHLFLLINQVALSFDEKQLKAM